MRGRAAAESARRVGDCVLALLREQPFFGNLALKLPLRADPTRETLASDGKDIRYSPEWVGGTEADFVKTAVGRVVLACALKHHTRRSGRDPGRWQRASQLVTHGLLRDAGFALPPDAEAWDGLSIEQAYDRLAQAAPSAPENGKPPSGASDGDGSGGGAGARAEAGGESGGGKPDGAAEDAGADATPDADAQGDGDPDSPNAASGGSADADGAGAPGDGSASPGESDTTAEGERPRSHDPCGTGEVMDAAARAGNEGGDTITQAGADTSAEEQAWDTAMHQALSFARAQGNAPGGVEETVREAHRHDLDWRALLRRYMTEAAADDYSWSLPNRRHIDAGLYLPALHSEGVETIAVIVDTSGSVDGDALARFWTEARAIASDVEAQNVVVLQVDSAVQDARTYAFGELPDEIAVRGRGGTDFRPGFAWLEEQGIRPACCLYFTDMICDRYPNAEPTFPVLWCNWGPPVAPGDRYSEPWGERIDMQAE